MKAEDTGIGIDPEDLPFVFRRFYRCDRSRSQSGAGLGLSLVKAVAASHAGTVDVSSTPWQGSRFVVTFPPSAPNDSDPLLPKTNRVRLAPVPAALLEK